MSEQLPDRDRLPGIRQLRQILAGRVTEVDPSLLDQEHDRRSRELLGDGPDLEDCIRRRRDFQFQVGKTIPTHLHDASVANDDK